MAGLYPGRTNVTSMVALNTPENDNFFTKKFPREPL